MSHSNLPALAQPKIRIRGAKQNNLKNVSVDFDLGKLTVVTGVSGSGKSSLVFDTLYAEGQRRYIETLSPYARQFLDRMDRPRVDAIEGVPPAIAIDQTNPVRTSRSTVGTMTELNDHIKLLFAKCASLYCPRCGKKIEKENPESIWEKIQKYSAALGDPRLLINFTALIPRRFGLNKALSALSAQGFTHIYRQTSSAAGWDLEVTADRFRAGRAEASRAIEAIEQALKLGKGKLTVRALAADGKEAAQWHFSQDFGCADCGLSFAPALPSTFSFNSPLGACPTCRGFGRVIGVDFGLVVPNPRLSLEEHAIKPWSTPSFAECQQDLLRYARKAGIPTDVPFEDLTPDDRWWILEGSPDWTGDWEHQWYGVRHFFEWLETKSYKMHIRVLLSRYRSYTVCPDCNGSRLRPEALFWRLGSCASADAALKPQGDEPEIKRFRPKGVTIPQPLFDKLPGLTVHDLMRLPLVRLRRFFDSFATEQALPPEALPVLKEIQTRIRYLCDVGVGYLDLDRQSRTLSGGEVQRLNLTTALGTSLVNSLFVLDEPSIGLHPRDMDRLNFIMRSLTAAGNTLVIVEHDPQVMLKADRIIDMGPGAGEKGGTIDFSGTPAEIFASNTQTGLYLSGKKKIIHTAGRKPDMTHCLSLKGVRANNLRNIDVSIPLHCLTCVTGVSGSGKSTLIQDVLVPAINKLKGLPSETPGQFDSLEGVDLIDGVDFVDQSPIGKTSRSNPVSYVGAFDPIRKLFVKTDVARLQGWTASTFSFNSGDGRCPTCMGSGYEHVEMQFLSDVYLQCPDCKGRRYRDEVLQAKLERNGRKASIADVLDMTVTEACAFFSQDLEILSLLRPLIDVGLDYLKLGQPVPSLSGGEAQRLKLAGFLAEALQRPARPRNSGEKPKGKLLVFDEPTTGLHFSDIDKLLAALRKIIDAGHSALVVEHNLDVIANADWIIDLGPEGGDAGGRIVAAGTVPDIEACGESYTGQALLSYRQAIESGRPFEHNFTRTPPVAALSPQSRGKARALKGQISVVNAREHNLKNLTVNIPRDKFTVVTGLSGSGKSTLAFDIVFKEGQRRYLESLNAYARSIVQPAARADVDAVLGIPPTVAIEQRTSRGGRKSTVATMTEIYHFLRLLFMKLGTQYCPNCGIEVRPQSPAAIVEAVRKSSRNSRIMILAPLVSHRKGIYTELAKWADKHGYKELRVDGKLADTRKFPKLARYAEHSIELPVAELEVTEKTLPELKAHIATAITLGKGIVGILKLDAIPAAGKLPEMEVFSTKRACPSCDMSFPDLDPRLFSYNSKMGWCPTCFGTGVLLKGFDASQTGEEQAWASEAGESETICPDCHGLRLNKIALAVKFSGRSISDLCRMTVDEAIGFFKSLRLSEHDAAIASDILKELTSRLSFLSKVGLGYLSLDRASPTLSGGEAQRIRLASQLGSNLRGVCYVLDEPTIGLHPRDNGILLDAIGALSKKGNTLLVVEHDEDTIRRADHIIDIGPGAGSEGGTLVAEGSVRDIIKAPKSVTGQMLAHPHLHRLSPRRPFNPSKDPCLTLVGARLHNLQVDRVCFPLNRLTVITGVSGSGKSSLCRDVLLSNLQAAIAGRGKKSTPSWQGCQSIENWQSVGRVLEVDQTPIGKTPRSCPATYISIWDAIRKILAGSNLAKERGYTASRFSFNTKGGRCETCAGQGLRTIEMSFLPEVKVICEDCGGKRFNEQTLEVLWKGKSAGDILQMSVRDAAEFFASTPAIARPLKLLDSVGLGYLTLGQPSPTLSGGEAQRIKLVAELSKVRETVAAARQDKTGDLYVLDEPTVGLHMADVQKLVNVLHRLVDAGNTVIVIEHNLDVMAEADWIIDMGPEGGSAGGHVVATGTPLEVSVAGTPTGKVLSEFMKQHTKKA
ncbi:excinuclease ABC subunit UvrA [Mesosutterella sp. OilRF-GAM-744-9]|uniref:UvrABC system protein A n=1 Tax=Mesosutterella porci TaxID=2915351 RepID=A0ABS9MSB4_9BURK|nr:excinuclease ABC subunit UvrA [Mesosutterella sp. oilRF-744-WT-GAM-9]MCG5031219.1 excinuclease ABC subunit UvrA [Mesosutterella sp. oilRF-744-WT-GAM-9]